MRAIIVRDDDKRTMDYAEVVDPEIAPDQVLLRARATAVNRADLLQRRGLYAVPAGASQILGLEVAGEIVAVGAQVEGWSVGDSACALLEGGGYAELVAIDASMLLRLPRDFDMVQAAAVPEVFYTAYLNVFLEPSLETGETVLIHAAASGVGTAAVQLCRAFGHRCFATATAEKLDAVRALGADVVIDRKAERFAEVVSRETGGRGVDVILDPVGGSYLEANIASLAPRGRLVNIGLLGGAKAELNIGALLTRRLRVLGSVLRSRSRAEKVAITAAVGAKVWPLLDDGVVRPIVHAVLPIEEAEQAHALLRDNSTIGKVVLTIG